MAVHGGIQPSAWLQRWTHLVAPGGTVLDVACGSGRNLRWLAEQGFRLTGVDVDGTALAGLQGLGELITADIEQGPWPTEGRQFDAVVVTNYLWRALWPRLLESVAPDGVLVYETFAWGQHEIGRPRRPEFLLQPGELLQRCAGLRVVAYEDGFEPEVPRFVQRIVAVKPGVANSPAVPRSTLPGAAAGRLEGAR